jgi:hypothetical protein
MIKQLYKQDERINGYNCSLCKAKHGKQAELMEHTASHISGYFICSYCFKLLRNKNMAEICTHRKECIMKEIEELRQNRFQRFRELKPGMVEEDRFQEEAYVQQLTKKYERWEKKMIKKITSLMNKERTQLEEKLYIQKRSKFLKMTIPCSAQRQIRMFMAIPAISKALNECPPNLKRTPDYWNIPISEIYMEKKKTTLTREMAEKTYNKMEENKRNIEEKNWNELGIEYQ